MSRVALTTFAASLALAVTAFMLLNSGTTGSGSVGSHWVAAPLLGVGIILSMGCLVAFATVAGGRRSR